MLTEHPQTALPRTWHIGGIVRRRESLLVWLGVMLYA